jgi:hypothetical protein
MTHAWRSRRNDSTCGSGRVQPRRVAGGTETSRPWRASMVTRRPRERAERRRRYSTDRCPSRTVRSVGSPWRRSGCRIAPHRDRRRRRRRVRSPAARRLARRARDEPRACLEARRAGQPGVVRRGGGGASRAVRAPARLATARRRRNPRRRGDGRAPRCGLRGARRAAGRVAWALPRRDRAVRGAPGRRAARLPARHALDRVRGAAVRGAQHLPPGRRRAHRWHGRCS